MHPALLLMCALVIALTGCSRDAEPARPAPVPATPIPASVQTTPAGAAPTTIPATAPVKLALSGEGLDFVSEGGSVRHLLFDTPAAQAIDAVSRAHGGVAPQRGRNEECGAGPLDMATWPDGLTVMSQDGRFLGWSVAPRSDDGHAGGPATMAGIGIDSTRSDLEAAYTADIRETTLGQEFAAGDVFGLLDGTGQSARINAMWAGASCNFR